MPDRLRLTVLGCGSSPGVPRINGDWGDCDPDNPRNRRLRASVAIERLSADKRVTRIVIDTSPDFREQMIRAGIRELDAVVYTHPHADHTHGIDDLRGFVQARKQLMDIYADDPTLDKLTESFRYCFETPDGSDYPPILRPHRIDGNLPFSITGEGGSLAFQPLPQIHGNIRSLGYRIGDLAYCPDISGLPASTARMMEGLDVLIIDALQYRRHPSHFSLEETLDWISVLKPARAYLTHMHVPLDYETVKRETPDNVEPCYDGLTIELNI